jgi:3-methyladenine DNA glycosylase AlkD
MSQVDETYLELMYELNILADPAWTEKLAHFGSQPGNALGIPMPRIRALAKGKKSHELALKLWESEVHEARMLASMVDEPAKVSREQMDQWVRQFDAWDVCDGVCLNLLSKTPYAKEFALTWCHEEKEFVRRAGFVLMAVLALHEKKVGDEYFDPFFPLIMEYAWDGRNFVKKALNWALRQIGKKNPALRVKALETAEKMLEMESATAKWIATDAIKELQDYKFKRSPK